MSEDAVKAANRRAELTTKPSINTLAQGSMFWQPAYLKQSVWLQHLPFLFWLVEAQQPSRVVTLGMHGGVAHFALCQAVSRLRLGSLCYAVHPWQVADTSEPYASLAAYNEHYYAEFSQLIDSQPTKALDQFAEGSVDLLLLNTQSQADDLEYLFERWLPKLSARAVVLVPSAARRDHGSQAFRDFEALACRYPAFTFHHGDGLGVLVTGQERPGMLGNLLASDESPTGQQVVRDVFARLGRTCQDAFGVQEYQQQAETLRVDLAVQKETLASLSSDYEQTQSALSASRQEAVDTKQRLEKQVERHAQERGQLAERASLLQEWRDEFRTETTQWRERFATQQRMLDERTHEFQRLRDDNASHLERLSEQKQVTQQAEAKNAELEKSLEAERTQQAETQQKLDALTEMHAATQASLDSTESEKAELSAALAAEHEQRSESERQLSEQQGIVLEVQKALDARFEELGKLTRMLNEVRSERDRLKQAEEDTRRSLEAKHDEALASARRESEEKQVSIDTRFKELATLTEMLEENEQTRDRLEEDNSRLQHQLQQHQSGEAAQRQQSERQAHEIAQLIEALEAYRRPSLDVDPRSFRPQLYSKKHLNRKDKQAIERQSEMIATSSHFDAEWYLAEYPDIADNSRMASDPARHYLLFGGYEGRNPGPGFNSNFYLANNPDVLYQGMNPLLHYVKFGEAEARKTQADD